MLITTKTGNYYIIFDNTECKVLKINVDEKVHKEIHNFQLEVNTRKQIRSRYYIELNFITNWIDDAGIDITWNPIRVDSTVKNWFIKSKLNNVQLTNIEKKQYLIRWKNQAIHGQCRSWIKRVNKIRYKSAILASDHLADVFTKIYYKK